PLRDAGQHLLDEHVLIEHQSFARRRTHGLRRRMEAFWQILQGERRNELFHIRYRADALPMAVRPVEAQGPPQSCRTSVSGSVPTTSSMKPSKVASHTCSVNARCLQTNQAR